MYKMFWPKFSICDLICHVYILFELVYNILRNKIQIWTFDSDNRIDLLREFNYVLGFYTDRSDIQLKFFYQIFSTSDTRKDCAVPPVSASKSTRRTGFSKHKCMMVP